MYRLNRGITGSWWLVALEIVLAYKRHQLQAQKDPS